MAADKLNMNVLPELSSMHWKTWAPRAEIAPKFERQLNEKETGNTCLMISSVDSFHCYGAWVCEIEGIPAADAYVATAEYEVQQIGYETVSVNMIITWKDRTGQWLRREYVDSHDPSSAGCGCLKKHLTPPEDVWSVKVELEFRWSTEGAVCFSHISICPTEAIQPRKARIMTTYITPSYEQNKDLSLSLQAIIGTLDLAKSYKPDLICLAETLYTATGYQLEDIALPLDSEVVQTICQKANEIGSYVVFNLFEKADHTIYNSSLLIDRGGEITGVYRKNHLPMSEAQSGVTPGHGYPVFETDFGTIGLLICWDQMFSEAAKCLCMKGAEIICISTRGEARLQQMVRAMDNGVYVVVAGVNGDLIKDGQGNWISNPRGKPSRIINPAGKVLGEIGAGDTCIWSVEIDLNETFLEYWMSVGPAYGEMRSLFKRERRPDTYRDLVK